MFYRPWPLVPAGLRAPAYRPAFQSLLDDCLALELRRLDFYIKINSDDGDPPIYASGELRKRIPATCDLFGPAYKFGSVGEANLYIFL